MQGRGYPERVTFSEFGRDAAALCLFCLVDGGSERGVRGGSRGGQKFLSQGENHILYVQFCNGTGRTDTVWVAPYYKTCSVGFTRSYVKTLPTCGFHSVSTAVCADVVGHTYVIGTHM